MQEGSWPDTAKRALGRQAERGLDLPDVLTVALSSPTQSVMDVLTAEGLGGIDLAAVACLCVPLWALPADQRATVAALCEHP